MKDTVRIMVESAFGFDTTTLSKNKDLFNKTTIISEEVRQLTGYTPEKVILLSDGNNIFIEYANNLERLMEDSACTIQEAIDSVMVENKQMACQPNIILDESCIDRVDIDALINAVGEDHIFRK